MSLAIDICICTFRRAHIAETLASVAALEVEAGWDVRVIVADNDVEPSAREMVEGVAGAYPFAVRYVHAPERNISIARNACLDTARGELLAFIDDDEIVGAGWLKALVAEQQSSGAEVVLGPVEAVYGAECAQWIVDGDLHGTEPVWVGGEIGTGYSCNVLMVREAASVKGRRFRLELGRSGGEDMMFFAGVHADGGRIAYAADAHVSEEVPAGRARFKWLAARRFRFGQTHGLMLIERDGGALVRVKAVVLAVVKAGVCFAAALVFAWRPARFYEWVLRGILHLGVVSRMFGAREAEIYGHGGAS
jgi:succinoglycan biosynthesis protein ExoM